MLTYRSEHDLPILLLNKDLFGVIFLILERFLNKTSGIFSSFSHFLSMNVLNMLILHFVRKVFWANFVLKSEHHVKVLPVVQVPLFFYPGEGPFPACHKGNDHGWE